MSMLCYIFRLSSCYKWMLPILANHRPVFYLQTKKHWPVIGQMASMRLTSNVNIRIATRCFNWWPGGKTIEKKSLVRCFVNRNCHVHELRLVGGRNPNSKFSGLGLCEWTFSVLIWLYFLILTLLHSPCFVFRQGCQIGVFPKLGKKN